MRDSKILIFDEPTSALTFDEVESFFKMVKELQAKEIGMIYITHRLYEVFEISTNVAIMCDGKVTLNGPIEDFTKEDLVQGLMPIDSEVKEDQEERMPPVYTDPPVFTLNNFTGYGFEDISLDVHAGEILGLAGVVGASRTELAITIFGQDHVKSGAAFLNGENVTRFSTKKAISAGINYVPEDRFLKGIFRIKSVSNNLTSAAIPSYMKMFLNKKAEKKETQKYVNDFRIKVTGVDQEIGSLSGGNQQKVVIARSLTTKPKFLILDEPTRGIDAAARGDVYRIINQLRDEGLAILLISSDIEEIMELSDRAAVMYQGKLSYTLSKDEITRDNLMTASYGLSI